MIKVIPKGKILNYLQVGDLARHRVRRAVLSSLNAARRTARQAIAQQFGVRTGKLRQAARRMRPRVTIGRDTIMGRVSPLPRLLNIYERGAVLAGGRGILAPRPVVGPAQDAMDRQWASEARALLERLG